MSRTNLRALGIFLGLTTPMLFCALALSCQSSQGAPGTPSPSSTARPTPYDLGSPVGIHDVDKQVGFDVVMPSYLPPTVTNAFYVAGPQNDPNPRYADVQVDFFSPKGSSPYIQIQVDEQRPEPGRPFNLSSPGDQVVHVGQVEVHCGVEPLLPSPTPTASPDLLNMERKPQFTCQWNTDQLHFDLDVIWWLPQPVPSLITSDMHDEAMKVVTSMIEAPYIP